MPYLFLVEVGEAIKVASTTMPALTSKPRRLSSALTVAKAQDGRFTGLTLKLLKPGNLAVQGHIEAGPFHGRVGQGKPLVA